jgi:hypothetical protein
MRETHEVGRVVIQANRFRTSNWSLAIDAPSIGRAVADMFPISATMGTNSSVPRGAPAGSLAEFLVLVPRLKPSLGRSALG